MLRGGYAGCEAAILRARLLRCSVAHFVPTSESGGFRVDGGWHTDAFGPPEGPPWRIEHKEQDDVANNRPSAANTAQGLQAMSAAANSWPGNCQADRVVLAAARRPGGVCRPAAGGVRQCGVGNCQPFVASGLHATPGRAYSCQALCRASAPMGRASFQFAAADTLARLPFGRCVGCLRAAPLRAGVWCSLHHLRKEASHRLGTGR